MSTCNCHQTTAFEPEAAFRRLAEKQEQLALALHGILAAPNVDTRAFSIAVPSVTGDRVALDVTDPKVMARIVGGLPTLDFPECCLVGHANPNGTIDWFCTGVLVHPRVILTAGHCFLPARPVNVAALAASNISDLSTAEIVQSRRFVQHPGYAQSRREHDISVMILRQDAATRPVPLASSAEITGAREVRLTGFGNDDRNSTRGFGRKRTVEVDVLSIRRRPDDEVEADEVRFNFDADLEFVAGGNGFDSCNGDSGGPAYLTTGASRKVAGLTSRAIANSGSPCGDGGVYTRIDAQMDFIGRVANQAGIALP